MQKDPAPDNRVGLEPSDQPPERAGQAAGPADGDISLPDVSPAVLSRGIQPQEGIFVRLWQWLFGSRYSKRAQIDLWQAQQREQQGRYRQEMEMLRAQVIRDSERNDRLLNSIIMSKGMGSALPAEPFTPPPAKEEELTDEQWRAKQDEAEIESHVSAILVAPFLLEDALAQAEFDPRWAEVVRRARAKLPSEPSAGPDAIQ